MRKHSRTCFFAIGGVAILAALPLCSRHVVSAILAFEALLIVEAARRRGHAWPNALAR